MGDFNVFCHQEGHNEKFWKLANSKNLEKSGLFSGESSNTAKRTMMRQAVEEEAWHGR